MKHFAFFLVLILFGTSTFAQESFDWPQWQGPDRNAISKERGLLQTWTEKGPPLAWKAEGIGRSMGGIAVSKGRIYTTGDVDGTAWLYALKEANGERIRTLPITKQGFGFAYLQGGAWASLTFLLIACLCPCLGVCIMVGLLKQGAKDESYHLRCL